jgi:preprotein translocase subunit YajC
MLIPNLALFLAQAQGAQPPNGLAGMNTLIYGGFFMLIFFMLVIRPQQKKQKELETLVSKLKTGDKVVISGGIHGIVANIKDGPTLSLKIADNVKIEVDKSAVVSVESDKDTSALPAKAGA